MFYNTLIGAKFGGKAKFDKIMAIETDLIKVKHSLDISSRFRLLTSLAFKWDRIGNVVRSTDKEMAYMMTLTKMIHGQISGGQFIFVSKAQKMLPVILANNLLLTNTKN